MRTGTGLTCPITAQCGLRSWGLIGLPIASAVGYGNRTGDGLGYLTNLGAGLLITTDAGSCMAHRGFGGLGRFIRSIGRYGHQPMSLSLDSVAEAGGSP